MTREEALDEYHAALQGHKLEEPATKERVRLALIGLKPFLEKSKDPRYTDGAIPIDLKRRFEAKSK